jgi:hypothetical protein
MRCDAMQYPKGTLRFRLVNEKVEKTPIYRREMSEGVGRGVSHMDEEETKKDILLFRLHFLHLAKRLESSNFAFRKHSVPPQAET